MGFGQSREPLYEPVSDISVWNMSIRQNAVYVHAGKLFDTKGTKK